MTVVCNMCLQYLLDANSKQTAVLKLFFGLISCMIRILICHYLVIVVLSPQFVCHWAKGFLNVLQGKFWLY